MSKTIRSYTSDGAQVLYPIDFVNGFIKREYVYVYLDTEDYTTQLTYTWISDSQIQLTSPVANGLQFHIRRVIPRDDAVNDYQDGAILKEKNLDDSYDQALMILEEVEDGYVTGPSTKIEDLIQVGQGASFVQEERPSDPVIDGVRWYKPSEATTYVWYMDDDSGQWIEENPSVAEAGIHSALTSELTDLLDTINIAEKFVGKEVFNTTLGRPVWAVGTLDSSVWNFSDGTLAHTPV